MLSPCASSFAPTDRRWQYGKLTPPRQTLEARRDKLDFGIELRKKAFAFVARLFRRLFCWSSSSSSSADNIAYTRLANAGNPDSMDDVELSPVSPASSSGSGGAAAEKDKKPGRAFPAARYTQRLPFRRIFTRNVTFTLLAHAIMAFHMGTFNSMWFVFLSTPVWDPARPAEPGALPRQLPFLFTGGVGLPPRLVGTSMAILGVLGIVLQVFLYPTVSARLGTVRSWRLSLLCFPLTYFLVPFLSIVPSLLPPPHHKTGPAVWVSIASVLLCQVIGRTFALPAQTILVNNCTPHPSVLGTLHGLAQSASSLTRTIGPILCGYLYGLGLRRGVIGAVWWGLSNAALCGVLASLLVREGDGHEIWLEGDAEEEDGDRPVAKPADKA